MSAARQLDRDLVNFTDPQVKKCYDISLVEADGYSNEERQVRALMSVYDICFFVVGPDSPGVQEAIGQLLVPELRPELCRWYRYSDSDKNAAELALRNYLGRFLSVQL